MVHAETMVSDKFKSIFSDLFGSKEFEWTSPPMWAVCSLQAVDAVRRISIRDGEPPLLVMEWVDKEGHIIFSQGMSLSLVDEFIGSLIRNRDLLAQMGGEKETA